MGRLTGKVAVISGTGEGQGRTAALTFSREGAKVVGCDINEETAAETLRLVREAGGEMECLFPVDLTIEAEAKRVMDFAAETYGGIDILYNNAMAMHAGSAIGATYESVDFTMRNTFMLYWLSTKHAVPHLREGGSVIFIASQAGLATAGSGFPGSLSFYFAYTCAKAAVIRLAVCFAVELSPRGIRSNCICPGPINTPVAAALYGSDDAPFTEAWVEQSLSGRIGTPEDIVNAALYLASDESTYMNGQTMIVDGGMTGSGNMGMPKPWALDIVSAPPFAEWLNVDPA